MVVRVDEMGDVARCDMLAYTRLIAVVNVENPNRNAAKVRDVVNVHQKTRASIGVASLPASRIW